MRKYANGQDIHIFNLSPPSAAYKGQWIGSALVQLMACRLFGAKPLSEPVLPYCQLGRPRGTYFSRIFFKIQKFSFTKMHLQISSAKWRPFCSGGGELTGFVYYLLLRASHKGPGCGALSVWTNSWRNNWIHSMTIGKNTRCESIGARATCKRVCIDRWRGKRKLRIVR